MKKLIVLLICLVTLSQANAQSKKRSYLEINGGAAVLLGDDEVLGGMSFLIGQQRYLNDVFFLEYQIGVAFPSVATAKLGAGFSGKVVGLSVGARIFPSFLYGQVQFNLPNGQLNFSAETSPFIKQDFDLGPSFGAKQIFTCGYQWNIGKSKVKKKKD
jgi:hypothetical protein